MLKNVAASPEWSLLMEMPQDWRACYKAEHGFGFNRDSVW
jgi:hypothetical protein